MAQDLTGGIRRAQAPARAPGHRAPSTAGINGGDAVIAPQPAATSAAGAKAPAFPVAVARHEDRGWHELHAVEHRAYTETLVSVTLGSGDTLTLDPTRAQVWRVTAPGDATVVVPSAAFPDPATPRQDSPERMRTWSCVLILEVPAGSAFPSITGARWAEGNEHPYVLLGDGDEPEDYGGVYVYTFVHDPISGHVLGMESGARF